MSSTKKIFIDTDCICSFLWVNEQNLLSLVYPNFDIIIPKQVYDEINKPGIIIPKVQNNLITFVSAGQAQIADDFYLGTDESDLYIKLITTGDEYKSIGNGEAAAIVLAKFNGGILASNNLSDISDYVTKYGLNYITTEKILHKAYDLGYITEPQGNAIWSYMISKRRLLPYPTFTDSLLNRN